MMSANIQIRCGLQIVFVCLYITPSHYHHCANLSEDMELIKFLSDIYFVECVSKIKYILSVIHYTICGTVFTQFTHFLCDDWANICILSYYHHQIRSMNYYPLFRVRSWNNGMRCVSFYILLIFVVLRLSDYQLTKTSNKYQQPVRGTLPFLPSFLRITTQIAKFMGSTWDPPGACRPQMGPMLAPWTLLYGELGVYIWTIPYECPGSMARRPHSAIRYSSSSIFWRWQYLQIISIASIGGLRWRPDSIACLLKLTISCDIIRLHFEHWLLSSTLLNRNSLWIWCRSGAPFCILYIIFPFIFISSNCCQLLDLLNWTDIDMVM